jgi:ubiquitin C-terminal hydrolase
MLVSPGCVDNLMCPTCNKSCCNSTNNYSLSVDIPDIFTQEPAAEGATVEDAAIATALDNGAIASNKLTDLLQTYFESEELDSDNMWNCPTCNVKVQASKSQQLESFPNKLMIQLKRFRFDPVCFIFNFAPLLSAIN